VEKVSKKGGDNMFLTETQKTDQLHNLQPQGWRGERDLTVEEKQLSLKRGEVGHGKKETIIAPRPATGKSADIFDLWDPGETFKKLSEGVKESKLGGLKFSSQFKGTSESTGEKRTVQGGEVM